MTAASDAADKLCDQLQKHPDAGFALTLFVIARLITHKVVTPNDLFLIEKAFEKPDHVATARAQLAAALDSVA